MNTDEARFALKGQTIADVDVRDQGGRTALRLVTQSGQLLVITPTGDGGLDLSDET